MKKLLIAIALVTIPDAAHAEWYRAESAHFVVYADDRAKDVHQFAEMLEKYHSAMALVTGQKVETPSPSNRVTIYAVGTQRNIRELYRSNSRAIQGFYQARAGGSVAFVPDIRVGWGVAKDSLRTLLHEYAHHFLAISSRSHFPRWVDEGGAEFFSSASFKKDGTVSLGLAANHRANEILYAEDVSLEELFDAELYRSTRTGRYDEFYGKSWALYHFLSFSTERRGQFPAYLIAIANGKASLEAARAVFGDIDVLGKDVDAYLRERRMTSFILGPELLSPSPVSVSPLSEGAGRMMEVITFSKRGVTREEAEELVVKAREIGWKYPNDAMVQSALAEAEFDSGNFQAAIEAADRAIAVDPSETNAYVQKGYALFALAAEEEDTDAAFNDAIVPFSQLNRIENDHPLPLIYYYRSYVERGVEPVENARHAIETAAELAPFDKGLWMTVAHMQAQEGKISIAMSSFAPVANDPHGGGAARVARAYISALRNAPEGEPFDLSRVIVPPEIDIPDIETGDS